MRSVLAAVTATSCVLGVDQDDLDIPLLHLPGHLAPGADGAEGGVHAVQREGSLRSTGETSSGSVNAASWL